MTARIVFVTAHREAVVPERTVAAADDLADDVEFASSSSRHNSRSSR